MKNKYIAPQIDVIGATEESFLMVSNWTVLQDDTHTTKDNTEPVTTGTIDTSGGEEIAAKHNVWGFDDEVGGTAFDDKFDIGF